MRVIAGKARGGALKAPQGLETRPTSDKAREAIFGSIPKVRAVSAVS